MKHDFGKFVRFCYVKDLGAVDRHYVVTNNVSEHLCVLI